MVIVEMPWHKCSDEGHLSGRDAFNSAGSKDNEAGRAASASAVRPLMAATEVPSAAESIEAAGVSACTNHRFEHLLSLLARAYDQVLWCSATQTLALPILSNPKRNICSSTRLGSFKVSCCTCTWKHCYKSDTVYLIRSREHWQALQMLGQSSLEPMQCSTIALCCRLQKPLRTIKIQIGFPKKALD